MNKQQEIAPGIYFRELKRGGYCITFEDSGKELIAWDYEEVKDDPLIWFHTLKAVAEATKHGPSVAKAWILQKKKESEIPPGGLFCTMCKTLFMATPDHPYVFAATLNGKKFYDFQCSEICNKLRHEQVYREEIGDDFINKWSSDFFK